MKNKRLAVIFITLLLAMTLFACGTPTEPHDDRSILDGAHAMNAEFLQDGIPVTVTKAVVTSAAAGKGNKAVEVHVKYPTDTVITNKDVSAMGLNGVAYKQLSLGQQDSMSFRPDGTDTGYVTFVVPSSRTEFVFILKAFKDCKDLVHIQLGK